MICCYRKISIFILILILLGALPDIVSAQTPVDTVKSLPGIEITTSVDRGEAFIGDLIEYRLTIVYDSTYELVPPPLGANLGGFDVKDFQADQISRLDDGRISSDNIFKLSTFTTGDYIIPPVPILFNLPDSTRRIILSESVPIKVKSMLEGTTDTVDIRPLKPQFEFERDLMPYYVWGGSGLVLLIVLALILIHWLRNRKPEEEPPDLRPPWEKAFEALALLQQKSLINSGEHKQFYVELSEIIRLFFNRVNHVEVMEMTTEEFYKYFESVMLSGNVYDRTFHFLKRADLVKFAKHIPAVETGEADLNEIHGIIDQVRSDLQREQQLTSNEPEATRTEVNEPEVPQ